MKHELYKIPEDIKVIAHISSSLIQDYYAVIYKVVNDIENGPIKDTPTPQIKKTL